MKKLLAILLILTACAKESVEPHLAQLMVEGDCTCLITYGISNPATVQGEDKWSTTVKVQPGDTVKLSVKTSQTPATLYMRVEVQEGLIFCKSLFIEPESVGNLNYIMDYVP